MGKKIIFIATFIAFFCGSIQAQSSEQASVKKVFETYKAAILNDQGEQALATIDSRTTKYYADIIDVIKNADSTQIEALSLMDKITVFSIRHRATKEEILFMNGNDLFIYAIKNGMVGKNSVVNNTIGTVTINGSFAKGQLVVSGRPTPLSFHFYKETGQWKLDLTSLFPTANAAFEQMATESGENENDFLFNILEMLTGRRPGQEIWMKVAR
jgi:hypothetical protein